MRHFLRLRGVGLAIIASAALAGGACDITVGDGNFQLGMASSQARNEWDRTYSVNAGARIEVRNDNGAITVEPGTTADRIEVHAERIAKASTDAGARDLLKQVEIKEEASAASVLLETRGPHTWLSKHYEVRYTLKVPRSVHVQVRTTNGGMQLSRLPNDIVARTTNGSIHADDLSGRVEVTTTNGGVDAFLTAVPQDGSRIETTNGAVSVKVPASLNADLSAHVTNGGISVGDGLSFTASEKTRRSVEGRLNAGGGRLELSTTNGGIQVSLR